MELDKSHHPIGDAVGQQKLEFGGLPEFILDFFGDIPLHFVSGRSRPDGSNHSGLDRKRGILGSPHLPIGSQTCDAASDHQETDECLMRYGPSGKIPSQIALEQLRAIGVEKVGL